MALSTFAGNAVLDAIFNATAFSVATPFYSLHTADPGLDGANEVTAGANSYARQALAFEAAAAKASENDAAPEWTDMPAVTITHVGVWDALAAGNFIIGGALTPNKTTNAGDTFTLPIGNVDATLT